MTVSETEDMQVENKRLFLSVSPEDLKKLDALRSELGMNRSRYIRHVINGQRKIVPSSIRNKEIVNALSKIDLDLRVLALKEGMAPEDTLFVFSEIQRIKELLGTESTCGPVDHKQRSGERNKREEIDI